MEVWVVGVDGNEKILSSLIRESACPAGGGLTRGLPATMTWNVVQASVVGDSLAPGRKT
jgi:hypothetical protein